MKKLMLWPLLLALSGCATYYYPAPREADGVYYAVDEPVYVDTLPAWSSARYYPWWSVDYFYLGSRHRHSSWSIGLGFGYDHGWYDPFYRAYSPWPYPAYDGWYSPFRYSSWYSPFYWRRDPWYRPWSGWNDYYWRHRYARHHRERPYRRHPDRDRYADGDRHRRPGHDDHGAGRSALDPRYAERDRDRYPGSDRRRGLDRRAGEDGPIPPAASDRHPARSGDGDPLPVRRHVSVAPGSASGRGMEIRSRKERKAVPTRPEPVKDPARGVTRVVPAPDTRATPAPRLSTEPYTSSSNRAVKVRRKAGSKPGRTYLSPVTSVPAPATAQAGKSRAGRVVEKRRGLAAVRSPASSKPGATRTQPIRNEPRHSGAMNAPTVKASSRQAGSATRAPSARPQPRPQYRAAPENSGKAKPAPVREESKARGGQRSGKGGKRR